MRWPRGVAGLCFGGDYNPEQWPEDVWAEDVELMRRARVTMATVGVFAWSMLEPVPGRYEFGWLDRVLDRLEAAGVKVALATPTASPPPWFSLAHPDALPVTAGGTPLTHGSRDTYCMSAPAYRTAALRIAEALGERYAGHPALAMWRVHNEYGTTCTCEHVATAFRRWLVDRYRDLDALNDAWTGAFWSQRYSDWAQVQPPRATRYLVNPSHVLDFRRFCSDELLAAFVEQRDVLWAYTPDVPVTTNYIFGGWVPVDHARWSSEVDLVAVDSYPTDPGPGAEHEVAFAADLARWWATRSPGGPAWLLMETAPGTIAAPGRLHATEPGRLARHAMGYLARGSRGAMFFQWRASRGGAETYHSALVPHAGPDSRVFREAVALGGTLADLAEADAGTVEAPVAVAWHAPSWWALQATHLPSDRIDYLAEVRAAHRALWTAGVTADMVDLERELPPYRLVVLPAYYLMSDAAADVARRYLAAGGRLVVTYLSGVADEHARVRGGGYPGALRDLLGIRVEEFHPLASDERVPLSTGAHGSIWTETVRLAGARPVVTYGTGRLDGQPAVTRYEYGRGQAWYVSTRLDDAAYRGLLLAVADLTGEPRPPAGVELVRRRAADGSWLFVLNHGTVTRTVPAAGLDLTSGARVTGTLTVPAGGFAVLRTDSAHVDGRQESIPAGRAQL